MTATATLRRLDILGPPAAPLPFPPPRRNRGRRDRVLCYDPATGRHEVLDNVLVRSDDNDLQEAYWKIPFKEPIETIMGHVEFCRVLHRTRREEEDDDLSLDGSSDDENRRMGREDEDEDLVFEFTSQRVAVKVNYSDRILQFRGRHAENPLQEIAAMQLLGDAPVHVVGVRDVLFDGQNLNVVMRYCDSGDLFQLLQDVQNRPEVIPGTPGLTETQARFWFRQLIQGVEFLHGRGICHRDLSPENVMIDNKTEGWIIDLGMCLRIPYMAASDPTTIDSAQGPRCLLKAQTPSGKLPYMSPEVYESREPFDGHAIDVWTCGTILFCMLTGNRSYARAHRSDPQFYWMTQGLRQLLSDWDVRLTEAAISLLQGMLQVDPQNRLTTEEIRNHPWLEMEE